MPFYDVLLSTGNSSLFSIRIKNFHIEVWRSVLENSGYLSKIIPLTHYSVFDTYNFLFLVMDGHWMAIPSTGPIWKKCMCVTKDLCTTNFTLWYVTEICKTSLGSMITWQQATRSSPAPIWGNKSHLVVAGSGLASLAGPPPTLAIDLFHNNFSPSG